MSSFKNWLEENKIKKLILCRGISGSGKSTLAQKLKGNGVVFSTDEFFIKDGEYQYDRSKAGYYHQLNVQRTEEAMQQGITPIVIDNTNVSKYEAKPYVILAQKYGYQTEVHEPNTPWKFNAEELAKRNKHGVSRKIIDSMIKRWDHDFDVNSILQSESPY